MSGTFWTSQTIEYAVSGPNGVRQGSLSHPFALVGSSQACDVRIDGDKIASRALLAMVTPAGIRAIVLTPGTKKSGRVIQVTPDRPLKLHDHQLSLTLTGAADVNLPDDESEETLFALTWQSGKNRQFLQVPAAKPLLVGRKQPAHLVFNDDRMSGLHCCVVRYDDQLWVIDLKSSNGTWVHRETVASACLNHGESFVVGDHRCHFVRLHTEEFAKNHERQRQELIDNFERYTAEISRQQMLAFSSLAMTQQLRDAADAELKELEQKKSDDETLFSNERETLLQKIDELTERQSELQAATEKLDLFRSRVDTQELELSQRQRQIEELEKTCQEIVTLRRQTDEAEAKIGEQSQRLEKLQQQIKEQDDYHALLHEELERLQQDKSALHDRERQLSQQVEELSGLEASLEVAGEETQRMKLEIERLQQEREQLKFQLEAQTPDEQAERLRAAEQSLREREKELEALQSELQTERHVLSVLNQEIQVQAIVDAPQPADEEAVISTFDFQDVLDEALSALPAVDDEAD